MKLKCDEPLSNVAFNINLRRYTAGIPIPTFFELEVGFAGWGGAGFRLTVSKLEFKARLVSEYSLETKM